MATEIHEPGAYCPERRDEIVEYVFDEMGPGAAGAFEAHIASCDGCRAEVSSLRETIGLIGDAAPAEALAALAAEEARHDGAGPASLTVSLEEEWALLRRRLRFTEPAGRPAEPSPSRVALRRWLPAAAAVAVTALLSFSAGYVWRGDLAGSDRAAAEGSARGSIAGEAPPPVSGAASGNYFDHLDDFLRDTHNCVRRARMIFMEFTNLGADSDPTFFRKSAGELLSEVKEYQAVAAKMHNGKLQELLDEIAGVLDSISHVNKSNQMQIVTDVKATLDLTGLAAKLELLDSGTDRSLGGPPNA